MANTREIKTRIKSIRNTAQITKAMQLVASSKMKRAQNRDIAGRPYVALLASMISQVIDDPQLEKFRHPLAIPREIKTRGILVISTDKGLCGGLNANLFRLITQIKGQAAFITMGKKASQFISSTKRTLLADFPLSDHANYKEVRPAIRMLINSYLEGKIDTIEILYPLFINTLIQKPEVKVIVPADEQKLREQTAELRKASGLEKEENDPREFIFEPDVQSLLTELIEASIRKTIYEAVLSAKASEHSARMVAMKTATENADKLISEMTLQYNKARQAAITQEILDISAAVQG